VHIEHATSASDLSPRGRARPRDASAAAAGGRDGTSGSQVPSRIRTRRHRASSKPPARVRGGPSSAQAAAASGVQRETRRPGRSTRRRGTRRASHLAEGSCQLFAGANAYVRKPVEFADFVEAARSSSTTSSAFFSLRPGAWHGRGLVCYARSSEGKGESSDRNVPLAAAGGGAAGHRGVTQCTRDFYGLEWSC
jgi:hypothetical protein